MWNLTQIELNDSMFNREAIDYLAEKSTIQWLKELCMFTKGAATPHINTSNTIQILFFDLLQMKRSMRCVVRLVRWTSLLAMSEIPSSVTWITWHYGRKMRLLEISHASKDSSIAASTKLRMSEWKMEYTALNSLCLNQCISSWWMRMIHIIQQTTVLYY